MVTKDQISNGIKNFVDHEIINKMQLSPNSIKRGLIVTGINLWLDHNINTMLGDPTGASALGIANDDGHYDVDKLAHEFKKTIPDQGYKIELKISVFDLGDMTIYGSDIDTLVQYIVRA